MSQAGKDRCLNEVEGGGVCGEKQMFLSKVWR